MIQYLHPQDGPVWRIRLSDDLTGREPGFPSTAIDGFIGHVVRWKNSPNGTLAWHRTRREFYLDGSYHHDSVTVDGNEYHFATYIPDNALEGLALVLSLHGRGEPAWLFSDKNGWERLADECREFAVVLPDSPFNIWSAKRDDRAPALIVSKAVERFGLDASRVYITGFSNGAAYTLQQASAHPGLFAAASPWNWPPAVAIAESGMGDYLVKPGFEDAGFEMPTFAVYGDSDNKAPLDEGSVRSLLSANGCNCQGRELDARKAYGADRGFSEGGRLSTTVFSNEDGSPRVAVTRMRDMPHGAIPDEARAAWEFMRRFRRSLGSKVVEEVH
jgi:poly(3-hydroxybutyrate) depolymerase